MTNAEKTDERMIRMKAKRYTAQEMRETADNFWVGGVICVVKDEDGHVVKHIKHDEVVAMLRQAADAMEKETTGDCAEMIDSFVEIYNIANDSDEQNWRSCMEAIQNITRRFV